MLKQAVRWRLLALNPASDLELPAVAEAPMVTLTRQQAHTLLAAARPREWLYGLILLGVATGARLGELLALQWADVDLEQGLVRIGPVAASRPAAHAGQGAKDRGWLPDRCSRPRNDR
jgi:integrase